MSKTAQTLHSMLLALACLVGLLSPTALLAVSTGSAIPAATTASSDRYDSPLQQFKLLHPLPASFLSSATTAGSIGAGLPSAGKIGRSSSAAEAGTRGGAAPVRLGQAGEDAVRGAYDIGPKTAADINGRSRIFDGLNDEAVSEVKNVGRQSLTRQLRDDIDYAQANGLRFDLYVRPDTNLSGPLFRADLDPFNPLNIRYIP